MCPSNQALRCITNDLIAGCERAQDEAFTNNMSSVVYGWWVKDEAKEKAAKKKAEQEDQGESLAAKPL